eukprot:CAMPEP_0170076850 /NCGR_PEP_ID=MMETSP0019_2-20121128/13776_1 /TAXON_ID=98059 /ORGANISM="Dinobryon sp., Strain UTEXLB2267" /LENGTH=291 /DNA_ID=CAMNT_0010288809 /DNA_START=159 /DNA_END=1034 /DNA_ORIENTATION=-
MVKTGIVVLQRKEAVEGVLWYKRVLPVGLAYASTLAFGNTVYLFLNVGFIQMLKSFTPVIIMLTAYMASIETPTMPVIYSVIVISIGTAATCSFSPELNVAGVTLMFLAELAEAIRLIFTQFFLQQLKFGIVESQYVLSPASAFWLFLASALYELPTMYKDNALAIIVNNIPAFFVASFMGIGVNYLSYLVIQYTSSLTMKILGTVRNIILIFYGVLMHGEVITQNEYLGYGVALAGFVGYNLAQGKYFDNMNFNMCPLCCNSNNNKDSKKSEEVEDKSVLLAAASTDSQV